MKIYTVNDFEGNSDLYGGSVPCKSQSFVEISADSSDDTLTIRNVELDTLNHRRSVSTFYLRDFDREKIGQMIELLSYIKENLDEVEVVRKLSGK